jgi:uncharacterized delta-60 repeat protein
MSGFVRVSSLLAAVVALLALTAAPGASASTPGELDPAWGVQGLVVGDFGTGADTLRGAIALPDGGFFLQGTHSDPAGDSLAVSRYTAAGGLDPAYGAGGQVLLAHSEIVSRLNVGTLSSTAGITVSALCLQPGSEKLVGVVAYRTDPVGPWGLGLLRLNQGGSLDASLDGDGVKALAVADLTPQNSPVDGREELWTGLAVQSDGKAVVTATVDLAATNRDYCVMRFTADGAPDPDFAAGGRFVKDITNRTEDICTAVTLQPDGKIVVIGRSGMAGKGVVGALRLTPSGALDPSFGDGGLHVEMGLQYSSMPRLAVQPDGKLIC